MELEGTDGNIEFQASHRAAVPDRARIDLPRRRLQLVNDLDGADLRSPGHRARRKRGPDQIAIARSGAQVTAHLGNQVPDAGMGLGHDQPRDRDTAGHTYPAEVVAHEVD